MKYFRMSRKFISVRTQPAGLFQASHFQTLLKTGEKMDEDFEPPLQVRLDPELRNPLMPTFFESPAWIATRAFFNALQEIGIKNIEAFPVEILMGPENSINRDYLLLNVVGKVPCANMEKSKMHSLGEGMNSIYDLVLTKPQQEDFDIFLVAEDTDCMLVNEKTFRQIELRGYPDVCFQELKQL